MEAPMRGQVDHQQAMFVVLNLEQKVPADHPLRKIKQWADAVLSEMRRDFNAAYSDTGRPGIPPEQMLKALLLQALFSIPSERRLMEGIDYNLLYRWFVDLPVDEPVWTPEAFSMNRDRFIAHDLVRKFFDRVVREAMALGLVCSDHFTVDGTLIRSLASHKSLQPTKGESKTPPSDPPASASRGGGKDQLVDWRGQKRSNATHRSTTDPEARLARKGNGKEAQLSHSGHVLMENRNGLVLDVTVDEADGRAERRAARRMLGRVRRRHGLCPRTVGFDTGYDDGEFIHKIEKSGVVAHVPIRRGAIKARDAHGRARRRARRRMKTVGYAISQRVRKRVEQIIGWCKTTGNLARTRFVGRPKIQLEGWITGAAYNLLRMSHLTAAG